MTKELRHINTGKLSLNKLSFDHSGSVLSAASANGVVRFVIDGVLKGDLKVSEDSCHAVSFDKICEYLVASGLGKIGLILDGSFKIFQ